MSTKKSATESGGEKRTNDVKKQTKGSGRRKGKTSQKGKTKELNPSEESNSKVQKNGVVKHDDSREEMNIHDVVGETYILNEEEEKDTKEEKENEGEIEKESNDESKEEEKNEDVKETTKHVKEKEEEERVESEAKSEEEEEEGENKNKLEVTKETIEEIKLTEELKDKDAKASALTLQILGDIPDTDIKPPENVLFVCKLNPITEEEDLKLIFSRFGEIVSCNIIKDRVTNASLQYGFIEFKDEKDCLNAYFEMDNVIIDDRRIHVDFCQSVAKYKKNVTDFLKESRREKASDEQTAKEEPMKKEYSSHSSDHKSDHEEETKKKNEDYSEGVRIFKYESDENEEARKKKKEELEEEIEKKSKSPSIKKPPSVEKPVNPSFKYKKDPANYYTNNSRNLRMRKDLHKNYFDRNRYRRFGNRNGFYDRNKHYYDKVEYNKNRKPPMKTTYNKLPYEFKGKRYDVDRKGEYDRRSYSNYSTRGPRKNTKGIDEHAKDKYGKEKEYHYESNAYYKKRDRNNEDEYLRDKKYKCKKDYEDTLYDKKRDYEKYDKNKKYEKYDKYEKYEKDHEKYKSDQYDRKEEYGSRYNKKEKLKNKTTYYGAPYTYKQEKGRRTYTRSRSVSSTNHYTEKGKYRKELHSSDGSKEESAPLGINAKRFKDTKKEDRRDNKTKHKYDKYDPSYKTKTYHHWDKYERKSDSEEVSKNYKHDSYEEVSKYSLEESHNGKYGKTNKYGKGGDIINKYKNSREDNKYIRKDKKSKYDYRMKPKDTYYTEEDKKGKYDESDKYESSENYKDNELKKETTKKYVRSNSERSRSLVGKPHVSLTKLKKNIYTKENYEVKKRNKNKGRKGGELYERDDKFVKSSYPRDYDSNSKSYHSVDSYKSNGSNIHVSNKKGKKRTNVDKEELSDSYRQEQQAKKIKRYN